MPAFQRFIRAAVCVATVASASDSFGQTVPGEPLPPPMLTGLPGPTVPLAVTPIDPVVRPASTPVPALPADVGLVPLAPTLAPVPITPTPKPSHAGSTSGSVAIIQVTGQPSLSVKQTLPESIGPGQAVSAEVAVTNTGGKLAENVVLLGWWTDGYDLSETSVTSYTINGKRAWGMGAIAAGETRTLKVKLSPASNARPTEFRSGFDATFSSSSSDTRSVKVLKPELGLQIVAPENVLLGQPITVTIKVKNPGQTSVNKISVQAVIPESLKHPKAQDLVTDVSVLQAGATEAVPLDLTATKLGETKGKIRIEAEGCEAIEQEFRVTVMEAKLAVTLNGPKMLYQNWPATYEAVIENQGSYPVKAASLEIKLPTGMSDLRASDKPGHNAGRNVIVWTFDTLQPGEKKTVIWFGFAKQAEDLLTTGTLSVGGAPVRRAEWTTKNLGNETK